MSVFAEGVISKTALAYLSNKSPYYLLGSVQLGLILMSWMANEGPYAGKYHLQIPMKWKFSKLHWLKQLHNMRKNDHTSIYTWKWSSRTRLPHPLLKRKAWQSPQMFPSDQTWSQGAQTQEQMGCSFKTDMNQEHSTSDGQMEVYSEPMPYTTASTCWSCSRTVGFTAGKTCRGHTRSFSSSDAKNPVK